MKKSLLLGLSLAVAAGAQAQSQVQQAQVPASIYNKVEKKPLYKVGHKDPLSQLIVEPNPVVYAGSPKTNTETVIGLTTYDLQTNASIQNRLHVFADSTISAVWTTSNSFDLAASDRGSGYNHFDGTAWITPGAGNNVRIESSLRTGWPSVFNIGTGESGEAVIAHGSSDELVMSISTNKGTGNFTSTVLPGNLDSLLWPRAKSNETGNKIHLFALTTPTANQGALYDGLDGAITYSRSTDGGLTWDIQKSILPGMTAADGYFGFSGDGYAMDVKGDTVVMLTGDQWYDTFIMKSTDGGTTWTKKMIWQNPMTNYNWISDNAISDYNNDGIVDTILANDGSMAVVLDQNGTAHCFFGQMRGLNDVANDGNSSYFPGTDGLCYWNENMPANDFDTVGFALDLNSNGTLDITAVAVYFLSLSSMPSAAIDAANGDIYLTFSSVVEDNGIFNTAYRNIFGIKSTDGGASWSDPVNLTPGQADEAVFGSLGNRVTDYVHLIFQRDQEPSLAVRGDMHAFGPNEIVYKQLNKAFDVGVPETKPSLSTVSVYPNPANNVTRVAFNVLEAGPVTASITNLLGQQVMDITRTVTPGSQSIDLDISKLPAGIYLVSVRQNEQVETVKMIIQ